MLQSQLKQCFTITHHDVAEWHKMGAELGIADVAEPAHKHLARGLVAALALQQRRQAHKGRAVCCRAHKASSTWAPSSTVIPEVAPAQQLCRVCTAAIEANASQAHPTLGTAALASTLRPSM